MPLHFLLFLQSAIAFTNVSVVDVEKGVLHPNQTVVIEGARNSRQVRQLAEAPRTPPGSRAAPADGPAHRRHRAGPERRERKRLPEVVETPEQGRQAVRRPAQHRTSGRRSPELLQQGRGAALAGFQPDFWLPHTGKNTANLEFDCAVQRKMMQVTAMTLRAGVPLLAGTETGALFEPGFASRPPHRHAGGSAVRRPRDRTGNRDSPQSWLDCVLLDADPLQSIANTRASAPWLPMAASTIRDALDALLRDSGN